MAAVLDVVGTSAIAFLFLVIFVLAPSWGVTSERREVSLSRFSRSSATGAPDGAVAGVLLLLVRVAGAFAAAKDFLPSPATVADLVVLLFFAATGISDSSFTFRDLALLFDVDVLRAVGAFAWRSTLFNVSSSLSLTVSIGLGLLAEATVRVRLGSADAVVRKERPLFPLATGIGRN